MRFRPRLALAAGACLTAATMLAACSSGTTTSASGHASKHSYTVYLSNNFVGNDWRVQMEKTAQAAVNHAPLQGRVNLKVENSDNTVSAQIATLNSIIQQHPDAIVLDPGSPDGLNPVIQRACQQHILVVSFDQQDTASCSYQVHTDFTTSSQLGASWLAKTLNGTGNIFEDTGLAGASISQTITNGFSTALKQYPNVHIVGTYQGQYALGPEQQGVSSLLAAHPNVNGILSQGYCTGAMSALQNAGRPLVPMYCQAYNGTLVAAAQKKVPVIITANPAWLGAQAIKEAVDILDGKAPASKEIVVPSPCFVTNNVQPNGASCEQVQLGKNAYPNLPPGMTLPVSPPWTNIQPSEVAG
jgi:ribose transport system substrate-binding protein